MSVFWKKQIPFLMCSALNHIYVLFKSNHICDMFCNKTHTYVAKTTKKMYVLSSVREICL